MTNAIQTLPVGSIIKFRSRGKDELWEIVQIEGQQGYTGVGRHLKAGDTIHQGVWKKDNFEVRRAYQLKQDCEYVPLDKLHPDTTEAELIEQLGSEESKMLAMLMGGGAMSQLVAKGHGVMMSPGGTDVMGGGWSWSWRNPPKFDSTDPKAIIAHATAAVDEYHKWIKEAKARCYTCDPAFENIEPKKH